MQKIIALVGMCGAGKSIVTDFFDGKGLPSVYFGSLTVEEIKKRGIDVTPENEKIVREELRQTYGMAAYAILSLPKIEEALKKSNIVIIDGLYSFSEYKVLKEKFGDKLFVIAVFAPPSLRYQRLADRPIRPFTQEQAKNRDFAEIENIEKGGPIAMADYTLNNTKSVDELNKELEKLFLELQN